MSELTQFSYQEFFTPQETAMLEAAEYAINADLNQAGECLIRVGQRLIEVKEELKEKGEGFVAWCNSEKFPLTHRRATEYMQIARDYADKRPGAYFGKSGPGFTALVKLSAIKDEEVKALVYEKTKERVESGEKVTRAEFLETAKALEQAKNDAEGRVIDLQTALEGYIAERKAADEEARIAREEAQFAKNARDKVIKELMEKDAEIKRQKVMIDDHLQEMRDAEEVYKEQLEEMRRRIITEERNRPKTDAEVEQQQRALAALKDEEASIKRQKLALGKEVRDLEEERDGLVKQQTLWTKIVTDFYASAIRFHQETAMLIGTAQALKDIPITSELHSQIHTVIQDADKVSDVLRNAISI